ncbi:MAG: transposase family protein [Bacteroidales bacterium]
MEVCSGKVQGFAGHVKCSNFDAHTPTKRGGQAVGYQGRKKSKTSNMLILTDNQGIPLACSGVSGNHNDAYQLEQSVDKMLQDLRSSNIRTDWLFLNADAGFDVEKLSCFLLQE